MKAFLRCLFLFFIGLGAVNAQEKVQDIIAIFQQTSSVDWSIPLPSSKEHLSINWSERKGSYNTKGYRLNVNIAFKDTPNDGMSEIVSSWIDDRNSVSN